MHSWFHPLIGETQRASQHLTKHENAARCVFSKLIPGGGIGDCRICRYNWSREWQLWGLSVIPTSTSPWWRVGRADGWWHPLTYACPSARLPREEDDVAGGDDNNCDDDDDEDGWGDLGGWSWLNGSGIFMIQGSLHWVGGNGQRAT